MNLGYFAHWYYYLLYILILTGLPTPLNDVPQGRHFFIRRYYWRNNIKWSSGLGNSIFIACICFVISVLCSHMISCFFRIFRDKRKAMVRAMTFQFIFAVLFSRNTCQFYIYVIISYKTWKIGIRIWEVATTTHNIHTKFSLCFQFL